VVGAKTLGEQIINGELETKGTNNIAKPTRPLVGISWPKNDEGVRGIMFGSLIMSLIVMLS
jgi:hypothetical protein